MQSLRELFKIGPGPSSSHTIAPLRACQLYLKENPQITAVCVELYGSLSLTGRGHATDEIVYKTFNAINCEVLFKLEWPYDFPNGLIIKGYVDSLFLSEWVVYSLGGGSIEILNHPNEFNYEVYPEADFKTILEFTKQHNCSLLDYCYHYEPDCKLWLRTCVDAMIDSVNAGLNSVGLLKGNLKVSKSAKDLYEKSMGIQDLEIAKKLKIMAYAYAANEENASGNNVVTAPTLGSCGVVASLVYYLIQDEHIEKERIVDALAVAGIFGNLIKQNATISGAVGGCQAEIGVACCMGSALLAFLDHLTTEQIEYAAEISVEHHLGLTCDPVGGYVIIPCIERNAVAAMRAMDHYLLAKYMYPIKTNSISFDMVVNTMNFTGQKIALELKETSLGGLAKEYIVDEN